MNIETIEKRITPLLGLIGLLIIIVLLLTGITFAKVAIALAIVLIMLTVIFYLAIKKKGVREEKGCIATFKIV